MKWFLILSASMCWHFSNARIHDDTTAVNKLRNRITLQINRYPSLEISHQIGPYILESTTISGFQVGYATLYKFNNKTGLFPEISTGISPYQNNFHIPENRSIAIGFREFIYETKIRDFWYLQFSIAGTYHILVKNNQTIFFTVGLGIRRDRDLVYTNSAGYRYDFTSPRITVFSLRTETSDEQRNMLTIPVGVYWEKPFAKRLFMSAGLRFTWLTRNFATGNYVFFPGYVEKSRGTVETGNYYLGIDFGFSWRKKERQQVPMH